MYRHHTSPFGISEKHTLQNSHSKASFSIVPACGGILTELHLPHKEGTIDVIEAPKTYNAWQTDAYFQSRWLLPFPNRLKNGTFQLEGTTYQFPINDVSYQNALHGFAHNHSMQVSQINCQQEYGKIQLAYNYNGDLPYYPFPLQCHITYCLTSNTLLCTIAVKNTGTNTLPIGLGWHPYFQFPSNVDQLHLQLPPCELIEVDHRMIPTGKKLKYSNFAKATPIKFTSFDTCFKALPSNERSPSNTYEIHLYDPNQDFHLTYFQDTSFPYFQTFTPSHRQSIALEPMTCNVDAFNNGEGLILLEEGKGWNGSFGVSWAG